MELFTAILPFILDLFKSKNQKIRDTIENIRSYNDEFGYNLTRSNRVALLKELRKLDRLYKDQKILKHDNKISWLIYELEQHPERDKDTIHNIVVFCNSIIRNGSTG